MKPILLFTSVLATALSAEKRQECTSGATFNDGNWYYREVNAITCTGVGGSESYNRVKDIFAEGSGICPSLPTSYSGDVAPLDQEVRPPDVLQPFVHTILLLQYCDQYD